MTTARLAPPAPPATVPFDPLYRIPIDRYHRMIAHGVLCKRDRVVLLDGLLVKKRTKGPLHDSIAQALFKWFLRALPEGLTVRKEGPVTLPGTEGVPDSEPEPNITVVLGVDSDYESRHPGPAEIRLAIEVAHTSLREDHEPLARYARAGIPEVWIVDLVHDAIERYTEPSGPGPAPSFGRLVTLRRGERFEVVVGGQVVAEDQEVDALLPSRRAETERNEGEVGP